MYITKEILSDKDACKPGQIWFKRTFPKGGELIDVLSHKYCPPSFLHWGYANLNYTEEEKALYIKKLKIECENMDSITYSNDIKDSEYVGHSSFVTNSRFIFSSGKITNSENVLSSNNVKNSNQIFNSTFVFDSNCVSNSHNVNNSCNICMSNYVVNSHSILNADSATNSAYCTTFHSQGIKKIKNCYFVSDCNNMVNSLFCHGIADKEFYLFNQQIEETDYNIIVNQMREILGDWDMKLITQEWPKEMIPLHFPKESLDMSSHYADVPAEFWDWVETLPGFNKQIMLKLTLMNKYL